MLTFQQIIAQLIAFWEKRGCIIHQGHDLETGAGTFNPATFLRCLGPEPYQTAYVEPSRRPKDGRFGENPNRIQLFHQFQVVLKPSPYDVQQLYLKSLEALGLNLQKHDIRFVHDDWESPTLGAYGLGWEVWVDGMEVSQFTYFQAVASTPLHPISAEITYGLERLAMYIQDVSSIFDVRWNQKYTIRDIIHRNEVEWSIYNFTLASTKMWHDHFEDYESEAKTLIAENLPIPAYDFVIKASHAFNMLDARGAISVTERTGYIARIRDLARLVAEAYISSREKLGFPLLKKMKKEAVKKPKLPALPRTFDPKKRSTFLLEIGSEELPATFIPIGIHNLNRSVEKLLETHQLTFEEIRTYGTPRRLAIQILGLAEGTPEKIIEKRGPQVSSSFDEKGHLTPQGKGFLKSVGISEISLDKIRAKKVKNLEVRKIKEQEYLFVTIREKGKSVYEIFSSELPKLILNLDFPKKMRWADLDISYPRPIHWIVSLYGSRVIGFQVGNVTAGKYSFGHAQLDLKKFEIKEAKQYLTLLKNHKVLADVTERKKVILKQLRAIEKQLQAKTLEEEKVLSEVLFMTEWPKLAKSTFNAEFLKVPQEVLISEMVHHQRYFPLAQSNGKLTNHFVITADRPPTPIILQGNQKVLSARLKDGVFLYEQDLKIPLESFHDKLRTMTFQKDLGSMWDKVMRICSHAQRINEMLSIADQHHLARAALLCKSDLASELVGEFPDLQGTIGKYYALAQNEGKEVATAIEQHWWPKSEQGQLPQTPVAIALALSDKIDNLIGYFSVGLKPTSSSDPYSLRRQTIGIIKMFIDLERPVNLKFLLESCIPAFAQIKTTAPSPYTVEEILEYITNRAKGVFEEQGFRKDEVEASLAGVCIDPFDQFCKLKALHEFRKSSDAFSKLYEVYKRAKGQLETMVAVPFNRALLIEPAEKELTTVLETVEKKWKDLLTEKKYMEAFRQMATLQQPLAKLFDHVKILADDPNLRANRIALLQKIFSHFMQLVDFSKIQML